MQTEITTYQTPTETSPAIAVQPTQQDKEAWTLKEKILFSVLGVVVVGGTIYIGRKIILNKIANKEENKSFEDGSSATYAKQIKMAFENDGWPGTDEDALRYTLRQIPSKEEFNKVVKSYQKLYNGNLIKDMSDELTSTEYNEMLQILAAKPEKKGQAPSAIVYSAWAKRLKAAFDISYGFLPGTDGPAIEAVFNEIPTQTAFIKVAVEYKKLYGKNLLDDLKSESEFGQYDAWMKIITTKQK
ncbi:MAG: hypothetical protein Q8T03_13355 [Bacteroidota bacterium]|nr:hypothetical protein [Bacteroidota bacterium]MDP3558353.1 hypothetical protein [Bacteroidota bacterium]